MIIEFKYSMVYDLMYHILAHLKVENASNLYSKKYIEEIISNKVTEAVNIEEKLSYLSKYYNENFDRLGIINFLPFYCSSVKELIAVIENYNGFTVTDKEQFIFPLKQIINDECGFYEDYWKKQYDGTSMLRNEFELHIKNEFNQYKVIFSHFKKSAVVGISYSLTNNGRGFGDPSVFQAVVPFVYDEKSYKYSFFQILHEYTHQFTNAMLDGEIRMDDGTHALSEKVVILFDYYLVKALNSQDLNSYLEWIEMTLNIGFRDENEFLSAFQIKNNINEKLLGLINQIIKY